MEVLTASPAPSHSIAAEPRFDKVRILADDLTGACDSAAAFLATGNEVRVWLGPVALHPASEPVQAFNTSSRALGNSAATDAVSRAASAIPADARTLWFKKVDSAGHGAIAAEVLAAHDALGTRAILFAPSFPATGRTVQKGVLRIVDAAGNATEIPLLPLFEQIASTAHASNADQARQALASSTTVLVCDASTQQELEAFASIDATGILFAGSAGLARALAAAHFRSAPTQVETTPTVTRPITISGSQHGVTSLQISHMTAAIPKHPTIQTAADATDEPFILAQFAHHNPDALILTGGDTALLVLQTLGAHSILLRGEMSDGIPWGFIQGGLAHGRVVVTKSGGFGTADSLTRIVQQLTGEISE